MVRLGFGELGDSMEVRIIFSNPPLYSIMKCDKNSNFTLPGTERYRIWTFTKQDNTLQLLCNGVEIFNFNYVEFSTNTECSETWSQNISNIQLMSDSDVSDTASDFYREYRTGKKINY